MPSSRSAGRSDPGDGIRKRPVDTGASRPSLPRRPSRARRVATEVERRQTPAPKAMTTAAQRWRPQG